MNGPDTRRTPVAGAATAGPATAATVATAATTAGAATAGPATAATAATVAGVATAVYRLEPVDGREVRARQRILVALGRLPRPFDRDADLTHVTGSAVVLGPAGVLLHLHKRLGLWLQPGGHLEPGETPWAAARREAEEETGLEFAAWPDEGPPLAHVDVHPGGRGHIHLDLRYVLHVVGDPVPRPGAGESQEVRWFAWPDAIEVADPGLAGLLRAMRAGRRPA